MVAALRIRSTVMRSRQECGEGEKSPRIAKTPAFEQKPLTAPVSGRCLLTEADVRAAIDWRLSEVPAGDVDALTIVLRPLAGDFREDRAEVAAVVADLRYPGDRRSAWSLVCAVLALDAAGRHEPATFWAAGLEVVRSLQQGQRGRHFNRQAAPAPDALDHQIAEFLADHPDASANTVFDCFAEVANGRHQILIEFDEGKDELVCLLGIDADALTNVGRDEFYRRVRRGRR